MFSAWSKLSGKRLRSIQLMYINEWGTGVRLASFNSMQRGRFCEFCTYLILFLDSSPKLHPLLFFFKINLSKTDAKISFYKLLVNEVLRPIHHLHFSNTIQSKLKVLMGFLMLLQVTLFQIPITTTDHQYQVSACMTSDNSARVFQ